MIFDPVFKRVWHLFKPWHLFPIVHLSRVERHVPVPVFTSSIVWLGKHIYKCVWTPLIDKIISALMWEDNECDEYAVND